MNDTKHTAMVFEPHETGDGDPHHPPLTGTRTKKRAQDYIDKRVEEGHNRCDMLILEGREALDQCIDSLDHYHDQIRADADYQFAAANYNNCEDAIAQLLTELYGSYMAVDRPEDDE